MTKADPGARAEECIFSGAQENTLNVAEVVLLSVTEERSKKGAESVP